MLASKFHLPQSPRSWDYRWGPPHPAQLLTGIFNGHNNYNSVYYFFPHFFKCLKCSTVIGHLDLLKLGPNKNRKYSCELLFRINFFHTITRSGCVDIFAVFIGLEAFAIWQICTEHLWYISGPGETLNRHGLWPQETRQCIWLEI